MVGCDGGEGEFQEGIWLNRGLDAYDPNVSEARLKNSRKKTFPNLLCENGDLVVEIMFTCELLCSCEEVDFHASCLTKLSLM